MVRGGYSLGTSERIAAMADPRLDRVASEALVSICAYVILSGLRGEDLNVWREELQDVVDRLDEAPEALVPLRAAARQVAKGQDMGPAMSRLHYEVKLHYARTAANRAEALRQLVGGRRA
jgi:hypothetical protein